GWPLSVVFVDLDKFKQINDTYGHQAGDTVLQMVAKLLGKSLRDSDIVARYGGDEFVLLLPGVDVDKAISVGERICSDVREQTTQAADGQRVRVTLSLGIATCDSHSRFDSPKALLAAADAALYHSKREGRDRSTTYAKIEAA
ncbi:MAG: GGDEF domain-containing protein, partial [Gammaproteobacteria bacterium]